MTSRSKQRSLPGLDAEPTPLKRTQSSPKSRAKTPAAKDAPALCDEDPDTAEPSPATEDACPPQPQAVDIQGWNVYVVDAYSLIFQVFHALPEMSNPRGEQVGAVYGFVRDMLYLLEEKKPNALIVAFD